MASSQSRSNTYTFEHPSLGRMTGYVSPEYNQVVQFHAIPYATLPARFKQSVVRENLDGHSRDFSKPGFAVPHTFSGSDMHSGGPYPGEDEILTSEYESLIIKVNVPLQCLQDADSSQKVPVMTYIHGGGFVLNMINERHNTTPMVQLSIDKSMPVIATNIQYRLGAMGFMATPEGLSNFGLFDQRNALIWIRKFIGGFGGNTDRLTVFGESAGAWSISSHMLSHPYSEPLFHRASIMSGAGGPVLAPIPPEAAKEAYEDVLKTLGIEGSDEAIMEQLRSVDVERLVDASNAWGNGGRLWGPVQDSAFYRYNDIVWSQIPELVSECEWVDEVMIGITEFEGAFAHALATSLTPASFNDFLLENLSPEATEKVKDLCEFSVDMDENLFQYRVMRWVGDLTFDAPVEAFCRYHAAHSSKPVYRYIFDVRNPFPGGPFYQTSHHWVDKYFIFRTMQFRFAEQYLKDISDKHALLWIEFTNGKAPWPAYEEEKKTLMIADEFHGWVARTQDEYEKISPRANFEKVDKLWKIWEEKKTRTSLAFDARTLKPAEK